MRPKRSELKEDVKELLGRTLVCESNEEIWARFSDAMAKLDESSSTALRHHFDGVPNSEIARSLSITDKESGALVARAKRQLIHVLRRFCKIRQ